MFVINLVSAVYEWLADCECEMLAFVEEHHYFREGLHEVDVVVAVLLDLQQQAELRQTLGGEGLQQRAVLLHQGQAAARYHGSVINIFL